MSSQPFRDSGIPDNPPSHFPRHAYRGTVTCFGTLPPSSTATPHSPAALRVAAARAGWRAARLRVLDRCRRHAPLEQPAAEVKETSLGIVGHPDRVRSSAPQLLRDGRLLGPHGLLQVRAVHSLAPHCGCDETRGGSRVTRRDTTRYDEIGGRRSEEIGGDRRRSEEIGGDRERWEEMGGDGRSR